MSFFNSWKALTNLTIRGRYRFLAVAFDEYFPVLIGRRHAKREREKGGWGPSKGYQENILIGWNLSRYWCS